MVERFYLSLQRSCTTRSCTGPAGTDCSCLLDTSQMLSHFLARLFKEYPHQPHVRTLKTLDQEWGMNSILLGIRSDAAVKVATSESLIETGTFPLSFALVTRSIASSGCQTPLSFRLITACTNPRTLEWTVSLLAPYSWLFLFSRVLAWSLNFFVKSPFQETPSGVGKLKAKSSISSWNSFRFLKTSLVSTFFPAAANSLAIF
jgi:hypothetical protein